MVGLIKLLIFLQYKIFTNLQLLVLISYLRHRRTKSSYHGFLKLHRDAVIASLSSDLSWNELNTAWASNFIREAKKIIENQVIFEALNKKVCFFLFCKGKVTP